MPFFSVIVPIYNVEKYLEDCVESILNQSFKDFELILVNDGSKDSSGAICDAYAARDLRVQVIHKPNGGVVSARKTGLQRSCGSYIVNIDSDDFLALDYLSQFYKVITKTNAEIITAKLQCTTEEGLPIKIMEHCLSEGLYTGDQLKYIYKRLLYDLEKSFNNIGCFPWSLCAKAVKRETIEKLQLSVPDTIRNGEDCAVMIPAVCKAKSLYVSNYCGYYYRQTNGSMIRSFNSHAGEQLWALLEYINNLTLPIPSQNLVAFAAQLFWGQMVTAAKALDSSEEFRIHIQKDYENVISFVLQGIKKSRMPMGILLRMLPIRFDLWWLIWQIYHEK